MRSIDDFQFIKLVESQPILYDKSVSRGDKSNKLKDEAWKMLSKKLNVSERACITRWKSIRDRFGREYRRIQDNLNDTTNWDLFPKLLFLKNHYKQGVVSNNDLKIKYEPKERKRKSRDALQCEEKTNKDIDPNEILLNQQLIALVKGHPVIYDKMKIRETHNLTVKNEAWREISEILNISEEICYMKWKKLRDRFAREYRRQQLDPSLSISWYYFSDLLFLESHFRKGVPLSVDSNKNKYNEISSDERENKAENFNSDDIWEVLSNECNEDQFHNENLESCSASETIEELVILTNEIYNHGVDENMDKISDIIEEVIDHEETIVDIEPIETNTTEKQLTNLIQNLEQVLKQAQQCLVSIQENTQHISMEHDFIGSTNSSVLMERILAILKRFNLPERNIVERKILTFLYELQLKIISNEDLEDFLEEQSNTECDEEYIETN